MTMRPTYDRNSFRAILDTAKGHGLTLSTMRLLTIGEREPDGKIVDAHGLGFQITVLEVFKHNVENIEAAWPKWSFIHMNCLELPCRDDIDLAAFDLVWWYHGPEHVEKNNGRALFRFFKNHARYVISSMPHGLYPQDELYGNPNDKHVSRWYAPDFAEFGGFVYTESENGDDQSSLDVFIPCLPCPIH